MVLSPLPCCCRYKVTGDPDLPLQWLPGLQDYFEAVHSDHWVSQQQCYFQGDNFDGAEVSISGDGCRPTINAMMVRQPLHGIAQAALYSCTVPLTPVPDGLLQLLVEYLVLNSLHEDNPVRSAACC